MRVLVISPHPDDETLGCGGTLLKHADRGDELYWVIVTGMSVEAGFEMERVKRRDAEITAVSKAYGFRESIKLGFPAAGLDMVPRAGLIRRLSEAFSAVKPEAIYLPHPGDIHSDHRAASEAALSAAKAFRCPWIKKISAFETLSETEFAPPLAGRAFLPNSFSEVTGSLERKMEIMETYAGETAEHPFPRSRDGIRALAALRGATAGVKYAEAFMVLKEVW